MLDGIAGNIFNFKPTNPDAICHCKSLSLPHLRFEYHPRTKKVYLVRIRTIGPEIGELIADDVGGQQEFKAMVGMWCKGYREGSMKILESEPVILGANNG